MFNKSRPGSMSPVRQSYGNGGINNLDAAPKSNFYGGSYAKQQ